MKETETVDLLNQALNNLYHHYKSAYSDVMKIPGLKPLGPMEQKVLLLFDSQSALNMKDVVQALSLPNSTVTSVVKRMVNKGLLSRQVMAEDRRAYLLKLTKTGREIIDYNQYLKRQFSETILESLDSEEEQKQLIALLGKAVEGIKQVNDDALRSDFMNNLEKEYNSFGPWLTHIALVDEIPQQYLSHKESIMGADYSFKVPVNESRRKMRPGLLMYNTVVSIYEDHLIILKSTNDGISEYDISFDEIRSLTVSRNLLDSHFIVLTDQKSYDIDYNSVSTEVSEKVAIMLRERIFRTPAGVNNQVSLDVNDIGAARYNHMLGSLLEEGPYHILAYQPERHVDKHYNSHTEAFLAGNKKYHLNDALFLAGQRGIVVIDSVKEVKKADEADYSYRNVFIQTDQIRSIELVDEPTMDHLKKLVFQVGASPIEFTVSDEFDYSLIAKYLNLYL